MMHRNFKKGFVKSASGSVTTIAALTPIAGGLALAAQGGDTSPPAVAQGIKDFGAQTAAMAQQAVAQIEAQTEPPGPPVVGHITNKTKQETGTLVPQPEENAPPQKTAGAKSKALKALAAAGLGAGALGAGVGSGRLEFVTDPVERAKIKRAKEIEKERDEHRQKGRSLGAKFRQAYKGVEAPVSGFLSGLTEGTLREAITVKDKR